jgi:multidrug efflux pump
MTAFFIDRPIFAWVISIVIVLLGIACVVTLPIAQYPNITPPAVAVICNYPGASAQIVADTVAAPIEQQVNGVDGMLYLSSVSDNTGTYTLTVTFEVGRDPNICQVLVQNRVSQALSQLPQEVQLQGVTVNKQSPNILLAINMISTDGRYDALYLSNYATIQIQDEILRLPGVGALNYLGQRQYSMRMWLDPQQMSSRGLTTMDVVNSIKGQNQQVAAGNIGQEPSPPGTEFQLLMNALGRLDEVEQFSNIIVKSSLGDQQQGRPSSQIVRIRDVARTELGAQNYSQNSFMDGQPSVTLAVMQLPGSNALDVADAVKAKMKQLKKRFPPGVDYRIVYDTTPFIEESVDEVFKTLRDAVILVAIVVLFFLQDWKAMILPMIDVPVSLIGTCVMMALLGFSLNNLTLFGLVLAIGIVVDDAIMVLENIERHIALGKDPRTATIDAMREITGPIVAVTLVLCSVFLPAAFIPGITGQFFQQFALVIASSMIISAINAMTLTPSRAVSIFKAGEHGVHHREALPWWFFGILGGLVTMWLGNRFIEPDLDLKTKLMAGADELPKWVPYVMAAIYFLPGALAGGLVGLVIIKPVNFVLGVIFRGFNVLFGGITKIYGAVIARLLRISVLVMLIYGGLLVTTYFTFTRAPTGFIPVQDQGYLLVNVQLPDSASLQRTTDAMMEMNKLVLGDPNDKEKYPGVPGCEHTVMAAGYSALLQVNAPNYGTCFVTLTSFDKRRSHDKYDAVIARKLTRLFNERIPDGQFAVFRAPPIQGLGNAGGFQLQVEQRGYVDLQELQKTTQDLVAAMNQERGRVYFGAASLYRANTPQLFVDIDRTKCEAMKVPVNDVFNTLGVFMGGTYVNQFNKFGRSWQVNIQADAKFRNNPDVIRLLKVRNLEGQMVPLGTVASIQPQEGPVLVMRYNMYASAPINGDAAPGVSSGTVMAETKKLADKVNATYDWTQIYYMQQLAGSTGIIVFGIGTVLVFLVLAAKYESWKLPFSVIMVVPMCLLASVSGMLIAQLPVDIFVQIGFLVLVGMAAKNAILIVEFAHQLQLEGKPRHEAVHEASHLRLRPIVMTSFAFILGVVPLVISHGAGAEMRQSLGIAVFSGMIGVTLFGIFLTPVFYNVIMWFGSGKQPHQPIPEVQPVTDGAVASDGKGKPVIGKAGH